MCDCLIKEAPDNAIYIALHLIQCSDGRHSPQGIYSTLREVHTHSGREGAPVKQERLGLKGEQHTEKERARWHTGTLALESRVHVSLNETVIAENKVSMVAARADQRPRALLHVQHGENPVLLSCSGSLLPLVLASFSKLCFCFFTLT